MDHSRTAIKAWLHSALEQSGETPTNLARRAGLASSTLTRFLGQDDGPILSTRTLGKIAHVTGLQPPGTATPPAAAPGSPPGLSEPDGRPYQPADPADDPVAAAVQRLIAGRNSTDAWRLTTDALALAGYLPGDIVVVDLAAVPARGDVVCAQVYRWREGQADTVFRVFEPPYLVAAATAPALRMPLVVDNERVMIKGVVTHSLRARPR